MSVLAFFFDTVTIRLATSTETYFDSLVRVIGPVKKAMHRTFFRNILHH